MGKIVTTPEENTPASVSGKCQLYFKTDDQLYYLKSDGTEVGPLAPENMQSIFRNGRQVVYYEEFLTTNGLYTTGTAISGGTVTQRNGSASEIGVIALNSSAMANSGYGYTTHTSTTEGLTAILMDGFIFKSKVAQEYATGVTVRIGFHTTISSDPPSDGAYFEIVDGIARGVCSSGGQAAYTIGSYNLELSTWYILEIKILPEGALFTVFDEFGVPLFSEYVSFNILTSAVGFGVVATESSTTEQNGILLLDYIRVDL